MMGIVAGATCTARKERTALLVDWLATAEAWVRSLAPERLLGTIGDWEAGKGAGRFATHARKAQ
jgi:hypothetical protein